MAGGAGGGRRPNKRLQRPPNSSLSVGEGEALRRWVLRERAVKTIEIGLAFGGSALRICEGLIESGNPDARHVVLDPFRARSFSNRGLRALEEAGVISLVEFHAETSQIALPVLLQEGRSFDFGFVDGNHQSAAQQAAEAAGRGLQPCRG